MTYRTKEWMSNLVIPYLVRRKPACFWYQACGSVGARTSDGASVTLSIRVQVLFIIASAVSVTSMVTKTALVFGKLRTRAKRMTRQRQRQHTFIGSFMVRITPDHIAKESSLWHLKSRFDSHKTEQMRYVLILLLAVFEDLPMVR
jgi:hypothetical protein